MALSASEAAIEKQIKASSPTGPRLTPEHISNQIAGINFHHFPGTSLTVCALTLKNGFHVVGHSASASHKNFNEEIGKNIAFENARKCIWELEGYLLTSKLAGLIVEATDGCEDPAP